MEGVEAVAARKAETKGEEAMELDDAEEYDRTGPKYTKLNISKSQYNKKGTDADETQHDPKAMRCKPTRRPLKGKCN